MTTLRLAARSSDPDPVLVELAALRRDIAAVLAHVAARRPRRRRPSVVNDAVLQLAAAGTPPVQIAAALGLGNQRVYSVLSRHRCAVAAAEIRATG